MGLFNFGKKKKLLALQNIILNDKHPKLIMSESRLMSEATRIAENDMKIIRESVALVNSTVKPDIYFKRYSLIIQHSHHLTLFEPYLKFSGSSPSKSLKQFLDKQQLSIHDFIERYYANIEEKANSLKTKKGKQNQYIKFYSSLKEYYPLMNQENIDNIESKYSKNVF